MGWINIIFLYTYFRYDAEGHSEAVLSERELRIGIHNPVGMTDGRHGIHPVRNRGNEEQVSLETTQRQSILGSTFFAWFKIAIGPSLKGFISFVNLFHPRTKIRGYIRASLTGFLFKVGQPVRNKFLVEKWGLE